MDEPKVKSVLAQLDTAIAEMYSILSEHLPAIAYYWKTVGDEVRDFVARPYPAEELEAFASRVLKHWGVGMGSFSDIYVTDRFEVVRDQLSDLLYALKDAAKAGDVNALAVRRHLTTLETVLLETGHEAEAARVRALLNVGDLDVIAVTRLGAELEARQWSGPAVARVPAILRALRVEAAPYVEPAAKS